MALEKISGSDFDMSAWMRNGKDIWAYNPDVCDGDFCPMNCTHCYKRDKALDTDEEEGGDED